MTVFYLLTPLALGGAAAAVFAFLWATKNGQLDDLETPALRMLHDDDAAKRPPRATKDGDRSVR